MPIGYYIYEWYIVPTNEVFYVGKGKGKRYKTTSKRNKFFTDMYNTHECAVRIIQDNLTEKDAFELEKYWIKHYRENTNYRLTNITDGGDGASGYNPPEDVRQRMSIASKTKWQNEEWKEEIIRRRHLPESTYQSQEFKDKISSLVTGEKNPNYQNYWSQEQKDYMSNLVKSDGRYVRGKNPKAKRIRCVETNEEFECIVDACEKYNIKCPASITICLKNENRTAKGLHFKEI